MLLILNGGILDQPPPSLGCPGKIMQSSNEPHIFWRVMKILPLVVDRINGVIYKGVGCQVRTINRGVNNNGGTSNS
jgi:hypothetical protein